MKKYIVYCDTAEIKSKDYKEVREGVVACQSCGGNPEKIEEFNNIEEAKEELNKYETIVDHRNGLFVVTEYFIEEYDIEYDEDGDIEEENFCGLCATTKMEIELVDNDTLEVISVFDNLEEAKEAENKSEKDCYIKF